MITLFDSDGRARIGPISQAQLQALIDWMEEESADDRDYFISAEEVELMEEDGLDAGLIDLLRKALAGRDEMDIFYQVE